MKMKLIKIEVTKEENELIKEYAEEKKISVSKAVAVILEKGMKKVKSESKYPLNPNSNTSSQLLTN